MEQFNAAQEAINNMSEQERRELKKLMMDYSVAQALTW